MENITQIVAYMGIFGIPSIFAICTWCVKKIIEIIKSNKQKNNELQGKIDVLMKAHQVQLRKSLMQDYIKYMKLGCIEYDDLQMWEDTYQSYHSLGQNGIMDAKRDEILKLPIVNNYPN